jgi:hypothetical protein
MNFMPKTFSQKLALLFVAVCIAYSLYTMRMLHSVPADPLVETVLASKPIKPISSVTNMATNVTNLATTAAPATQSKPPISMTPAEHADLIGWNEEQGYTSKEEDDLYASYDQATLEKLVENRDITAIIALDALESKALERGEREKALQYVWHAAALGSTPAFSRIASLLAPGPERTGNINDYKPEIIKAFAIYKVAAMRGDLRTATVSMKSKKEIYEMRGKLELSPEDLQQIDAQAQKYYADLQALRYQLGLGDFKNSTPKFLKDMYGSGQ